MKPTHLLSESLQITKTSEESNPYIKKPWEAKIYTADFDNYLNQNNKVLKSHTAFDELVKKWEQEEPEEVFKARNWVADSFYNDDGETIKTMRLRKGLSQAQLAKTLDTRQSYISRIECGTVDLMYSTMVRLCQALDVDMNALSTAIDRQKEISQ